MLKGDMGDGKDKKKSGAGGSKEDELMVRLSFKSYLTEQIFFC